VRVVRLAQTSPDQATVQGSSCTAVPISEKTMVKIKVKFTLKQSIKAQCGSRGIGLL